MKNTDTRLSQLRDWLRENFGNVDYTLTPVSGDASFRRYFRFSNGNDQFIAVDSPPDKENNDAFVHVTHLLEAEGLAVPHVHFSSLDFGFFLLSDFGDKLLLDILNQNNADELYSKALDALIVIQQTSSDSLPLYDKTLLQQEMELFRKWFISEHLDIHLSENENNDLNILFDTLSESVLQQPQVFVHRDYHSRNLMQTQNEMIGIIDYQDAVRGPISYDLVSLLRDCYIQWPEDKITTWVLNFYNKLLSHKIIEDIDEETFLQWFDLMGIQRHLKAVGIFARLNIRDNKPNYLKDIPRTLNYIKSVSIKYPKTEKLAEIINTRVHI